VRNFELVRSDGSRRYCSPFDHPDWFAATIGGMGLTGWLTWVEIQLRPIQGPWIEAEDRPFRNLGEFFELSEKVDKDHEFTVAWVDCAARGDRLGRGIFTSGDFSRDASAVGKVPRAHGRLSIPVVPPFSLVNQLSLKAFNALYARKPAKSYRTHYQPFFYPLDSIGDWNRLYGPKGFLQYQCTFPPENGREALGELLDRISRSGQGSFLAVLKKFGDRVSPGVLSFPAPGFTIALDFPMRGSRTLRLLEELDGVVEQACGRLYPAKDARMSREAFLRSFPQYADFQGFRDPAITSDFARRVLPPLAPTSS
jgi:FAD/FMN-containing dehydrogenase